MQTFTIITIFLLFPLRNSCPEEVVEQFNGYRVYRFENASPATLEQLQELQLNATYTFWTSPETGNMPIDVMIAPDEQDAFEQSFENAKVFISDVQMLIDNERPMVRSKMARFMSWDDYYTYEEVNDWLERLTEEFPDTVQLIHVGKSYEGRNITGVRVSFRPENVHRGVLLEGGMHAREWIGVATVTYQLNEILRSSDPNVRETVENYDWYVFPIYNPDGYAYTFSTNRMWRKTRTPQGFCTGVDPNRNWDYKWHVGDRNYINACSDSYAGRRAFSEPETKQISEYLRSIGPNLVGYISHHSYSQIILLPYGDSPAHQDNYDELYSVGTKMVESIKQIDGTHYKLGNIVELLYVATGNDVDWVKHNLGTRMTYIYELRDRGRFGFLLPASHIIPTGQETFAGLMTMLQEFEKIDSAIFRRE